LIHRETISKNCDLCGQETYHFRQEPIVPRPGEKPELVVRLQRFNAERCKLRNNIALPSALFVVPNQQHLYFLKYIAVHVGSSVHHGHYFSFERPNLAQLRPQALDENLQTECPRPSEPFNTWTKYEDSRKTENVDLGTIQENHGGDTYLLQLTPVAANDMEVLISTEELIAKPLAVILEAVDGFKGSLADAIDSIVLPASEAILTSLRDVYADVVLLLPSQRSISVKEDRTIWMAALTRALGRASFEVGIRSWRLTMFIGTWLEDSWMERAAEPSEQESLQSCANTVLKNMLSPLNVSHVIHALAREYAGHEMRTREHLVSRQNNTRYEDFETQQRQTEEQQKEQQRALEEQREKQAAEEEAKKMEREKKRKELRGQLTQINQEELAALRDEDQEALRRAEEDRTLELAMERSRRQHRPLTEPAATAGANIPSPADLKDHIDQLGKELKQKLDLFIELLHKYKAIGGSSKELSSDAQELQRLSQELNMPPPR
jgi:hypothetical protein